MVGAAQGGTEKLSVTAIIDLTGCNLINYLLRMIRDIVDRNPRFKQTLGEVVFPANTIMRWKDVWISVTSVTTSGTRLSPNYFMCTQRGRAILAKVGDKDGQFVEWTRETDRTRQTPAAGVYYINVDFFDDRTRDLGLTVHKYRWVEGKLANATGTVVRFRPGVDVGTVVMHDASTGDPVEFKGFNQSGGAFAYLLDPTQQLACRYTDGTGSPPWDPAATYSVGDPVTYQGRAWVSALDGNAGNAPGDPVWWSPFSALLPTAGQNLAPLADFWYERPVDAVICERTSGGAQLLGLPTADYFSVVLRDQSGYRLRPGLDYTFQGAGFVLLAPDSPPGSRITATQMVKVDPYGNVGTMPENVLQVDMAPGETLAPGQVFIHTTQGDFTDPVVNPDGTLTIPRLLEPGDWLRWEVRVDSGQSRALARKWELNSLLRVDPDTIGFTRPGPKGGDPIPATWAWVSAADDTALEGVVQTSAGAPLLAAGGEEQPLLPGLRLAVGDNVVVGDQCAVIVSPTVTETYEVFGSKENLDFTLEVKANDLQTASDLSEMLKRELLVTRRTNAEADGLTIFEASRSFVGQARDASGTAPSYVYTVSVSASADWKVYVPLVTRLVGYELAEVEYGPADFPGKLQAAPRMEALGSAAFIPDYK